MTKHIRRDLVALALVFSLGAGAALASSGSYASWLFGTYQWTTVNYGIDWKLVNVQTEQSTGRVLLFWQNQATGEVAIHLYRNGDTGFGGCHDATTGIPIACASGAVIN